MEFQDKRILVCSHYSAPYAGNFIKSFLFLSKYVSEIAFVFPLETKERDWIKDIKHKVYFASPVSPKSCQELESIIQDFQPNIVHCNFEGYDIAAVQAIRHLDMKNTAKWFGSFMMHFLTFHIRLNPYIRGFVSTAITDITDDLLIFVRYRK